MGQPLEGILEQLQERIYDALRAQHDLQKVAIAIRKRSSLELFCEQLIQQSLGEGIFIDTPLPKVIVSGVPGPVYQEIAFAVQVIENVATNESGSSGILVAEKIAHHLHLREFVFGDQSWIVSCREKDPWQFEGDAFKNTITLHFTTMYSF
ncbi:MAG: hypothetical protein K2L24_03720 [Opitutales bacterium]|nr:hypothetical protein [Opitutales bacterium]